MAPKSKLLWQKMIEVFNEVGEGGTIRRNEWLSRLDQSYGNGTKTVDSYRAFLVKLGYIKVHGRKEVYEVLKSIPPDLSMAEVKQILNYTIKPINFRL
jgi:hypothetical protein